MRRGGWGRKVSMNPSYDTCPFVPGGKKSSSLRLPAPLSAPEQERTARSALYERTKEDVGVWDAVVHSSRAADTKKFPLAKPDLRLATARDYSVGFRPRNALEEQVMSLLRKSKVAEESSKLSEKEEATLAQLSVRDPTNYTLIRKMVKMTTPAGTQSACWCSVGLQLITSRSNSF